jgi:alpha-D-ribose 1-methylphosphonate 5-triphosphate synthase subunit PhnI
MTHDAQELLRKAMSMAPQDRALVAHELIRSLESEFDPDVEAAWQEEVASRH